MVQGRSPYFELFDADRNSVALLRSDGNPEVPMGYQTDPKQYEGLADMHIGPGPDTFVLPPSLPAGSYSLCEWFRPRPNNCIELIIAR
jgi:hypothetical protein